MVLQSDFRAARGAETNGGRETVRARVYADLRRALITGRIAPNHGMTLRGLATDLGVSPMPVREAVHRLVAERALAIGPTGRIQIPEMTPRRFRDLVRARLLLEPEVARMAAAMLDRQDLAELKALDDGINLSLETGDVEAYMAQNHAFHFRIYAASRSDVIVPLVESIWLQFGPFMRTVYGRIGTANLADQHEMALAAIAKRDADALAIAIERDIGDGMGLIGGTIFRDAVADDGSTATSSPH